MNLVALYPSDRLGVVIRDLFLKKLTKRPMAMVDITPAYNYFCQHIQDPINLLSKQGNVMLFRFMVEYYILNLTYNNWLLYNEGIGTGPIDGYMEVEVIASFIENNHIPFSHPSTPLEYFQGLIDNGVIYTFQNLLLAACTKANVRWDDGKIYEENSYTWHIGVEFIEKTTDPATFRSRDILEYRTTYPYDKDISLVIVSLSLEEMSSILDNIVNSITYCLEPASVFTEGELDG